MQDFQSFMKIASRLDGHRLVAIEKISGCAYLRAVFAAWRAGDIVVPINAGGDAPDIGRALDERIVPAAGGGWFEETLPLDPSDAPAQISTTSGTTGAPKAILLSRRALSDVTARLVDMMALDASIREYVGVPVTYSFGLGRARAIAAVGGKAYLPEHGFRPDELAQMLRDGQVNALCAVPTLLRLLLAQCALFADCADKLRWLEIGSQYMSGEEKAEVRALFPNARIVQHYGLTEASRSTFLRVDGAPQAALESVGTATGDVRIRVDADGLICVAGPHVADGRILDGELVALTDEEGWLRTSDKGALEDGLLYYQGRADDVLNISGVKVSAEHFEQKLLKHLGLETRQVAVAGRDDPLRGQAVMVAHLREVDAERLRGAAHDIAAQAGLGAADVALVCVEEIPRTETGKVKRSVLTEQHGRASVSSAIDTPGDAAGDMAMSPREAQIAAIWQEALGIHVVSRDESFFDIGGDSLSAITVALRAEQHHMPEDVMHLMFEGRTIAEIAALLDGAAPADMQRSRTAILGDTINVTRGLFVLLVIAAHWAPFLLVRMDSPGFGVDQLFAIVFAMGTPGFAMIFGIGLSFFYLPLVERAPDRLASKLRSNSLILGVGVLVIAAVAAVDVYLTQGYFDRIWPERVFFNVILGYFLLMLFVPVMLWLVRRTPHVAFNALAMAAGALIILNLTTVTLGADQFAGFANLGRLMLVSLYSLPQMVTAASIGMALGQWIRMNGERPDLPALCAQLGALLIVTGSLFLLYTGGFWVHLHRFHYFILYAGVLLLCFTLFFKLVEARRLRMPLRFLLLLGLLSFPAFVTHILVIPIKNILVDLGLVNGLALGLPLLVFVGLAAFAMLRLNRIYFAKG